VTTWADEGPGLQPNDAVANLVARADERVAPLVNRVIGQASTDLTRAESPAGESALGNLIADAQRAAMGTDVALVNAGGIRADIAAGDVTWGELFSVQPFNNDLVRLTLTGSQIVALLNQQWDGQSSARILKPAGLTYRWLENGAGHTDNRVDAASIQVKGAPLDPNATYSVAVNSFLASGGDNFTVLTQGTNRIGASGSGRPDRSHRSATSTVLRSARGAPRACTVRAPATTSRRPRVRASAISGQDSRSAALRGRRADRCICNRTFT